MLYASQRHEADFDAPVQGGGKAIEHRKGVSLVIRIFEPADHGGARSDQFRQLPLGEIRLRAQLDKLSRHCVDSAHLVQFCKPVWLSLKEM